MPKKQSSATKAKKNRALDKEKHEKAKSQIAAAQSTDQDHRLQTSSTAPQPSTTTTYEDIEKMDTSYAPIQQVSELDNDQRTSQSTHYEHDPTNSSTTRTAAIKRRSNEVALEPNAKRTALAENKLEAAETYKFDVDEESENHYELEIDHLSQRSLFIEECAAAPVAYEFDDDKESEHHFELEIDRLSHTAPFIEECAAAAEVYEYDDKSEHQSQLFIDYFAQKTPFNEECAASPDALGFDDDCEHQSKHDIIQNSIQHHRTTQEAIEQLDQMIEKNRTIRRDNPNVLFVHPDPMEFDEPQAAKPPKSQASIPLIEKQPQSYMLDWFNDAMMHPANSETNAPAYAFTQEEYLLNDEEIGEPAELIEQPDYNGLIFCNNELLSTHRYFNDAQIMAYLGAMAAHASNRCFNGISILDTYYLDLRAAHYANNRDPNVRPFDIRTFLRVFPDNPELILCPLRVHGNHWTLLSINVLTEQATYYDSLSVGACGKGIPEDERALCQIILDDLCAAGVIGEGVELRQADLSTFNHQRDGFNCGPFILMYAEHIAFHGASIQLHPLNIEFERQRMLYLLKRLNDLNVGKRILENLHSWSPTLYERNQTRPLQLYAEEGPSELPVVNNLIKIVTVIGDTIVCDTIHVRRSQRILPRTPFTQKVYYEKVQREINYLRQRGRPIGLNSSNISPDVNYLGPMAKRCPHCKAYLFDGETSNACCSKGVVTPPNLPRMPARWDDVYQHMEFQANPRKYNNLMSMASRTENVKRHMDVFKIQGEIHHDTGDLIPVDGKAPAFNQNYMLEYDDAVKNRLKNDSARFTWKKDVNNKLIIGLLEAMLREYNPLAKALFHMKDVLAEYEAECLEKNEEVKRFYLVWENGKDAQTHRGCLNIPTVEGQIFSIYRSEDGEPPKGIMFGIARDGRNNIRHIPFWDPHRDAAAYPLIFVFGQEGWQPGIKKLNINQPPSGTTAATAESDEDRSDSDDEDEPQGSKTRTDISLRQHYKSMIFDRNEYEKKVFNPVTGQKDLSASYIINAHLNVERQQLDKMEEVQENYKFRSDGCDRLRAALQAKIDGDQQLKGKKLGKTILLNKNYRGGRRYMQKKFKDNIAICNRFGAPTLFVTFTGNPRWQEITENLRPGEKWIDRPDLICRVFNLKAKLFLDDILKSPHLLGRVKAYSATLEHQKRGMPHLHILLIMEDDYKYETPEKIDDLISAQLPTLPDENDKSYEADHQRRYYEYVLSYMVHDPKKCKAVCGLGRQPGICGKDFPKAYAEETVMRKDGYAQMKRPDDGRSDLYAANGKLRAVPITNQYVIAHNRYLLLKFNSHINVEHCGGVRAIKYLYKYINKGTDQAFVSVRQHANFDSRNDNIVDYNEIVQYRKVKVTGAAEAMERLLGMFVTKMSHSVHELEVHLEGQHNVVFNADADEQQISDMVKNDGTDPAGKPTSRLTAFFKLVNQELAELTANSKAFDKEDSTRSINLLYHQVPEYYKWDKPNKLWIRRKNVWKVLGRLCSVYPSNVEVYCLRELLKMVRGPRCYQDIRTMDGQIHASFHAAAVARRLFVDDKLCYQTMDEIIKECMPRECRVVFALLLVYNQPTDPEAMWEKYCDHLIDRNSNQTKEVRIRRALAHIASILFHHQKTTKDFQLPDVPQDELLDAINDAYPVDDNDGAEDYERCNPEQKAFIKKVLYSLDNTEHKERERLFFLQGSGGTGKTFVYNTLINMARSRGKKVIAVASTGIAAILLNGGQTAHSAFRIPLDIHQEPNISLTHPLAQLIKEADLIIWDESPMQHNSVLKHVAALIKKLSDVDTHHSKFGNKTVILGGDFKQLLPVMRHESARASYEASLLCSELFIDNFKIHTLTTNVRASNDPTYSAWLNDIGNGKKQNAANKVQLPDDIVAYHQDPVIDFVYPPELFKLDPSSTKFQEYVSDAVLMAPLNATVQDLNEKIIAKLQGSQKEYIAINNISNAQYPDDEFFRDTYDPEILATFEHSSIPANKIILKVGSVVMLTRNLDIRLGLCNGTRMIVEKLNDNYISCRIITGSSKGQLIPIFALPNNYCDSSDDTWPEFTRTQLPIRPAFAMSINKAQGQTIKKVGVILNTDCFSHGQFYVAVSRVRSREDIRIFVRNENTIMLNGKKIPYAKNIVFKEVLAAIEQHTNRQ